MVGRVRPWPDEPDVCTHRRLSRSFALPLLDDVTPIAPADIAQQCEKCAAATNREENYAAKPFSFKICSQFVLSTAIVGSVIFFSTLSPLTILRACRTPSAPGVA